MSRIHPSAIVEAGAELGADVEIGPFSVIGASVKLANSVKLESHVVVLGETKIGAGTVIHSHAVLGGGPQYRGDDGADAKLIIGENNIIREHVTMNGGSKKGGGVTQVGSKGYFMAYSHVAHDCHIGNNVTFANGVALAGHVTIEDNVIVGGLSAIQQFVRIGRNAFIGGVTGVPDDVIPYGMAIGDRARLLGLNLIGLKRQGLSRAEIQDLRTAFRFLFSGEGNLSDRIDEADHRWSDSKQVKEIVAFMKADSKHPLCMPWRARDSREQD